MKRWILMMWLIALSVACMAQRAMLSGIVVDDKSGQRIAQTTVSVEGTNLSVVTNDDGYFTLKADSLAETCIIVSHIGYQSKLLKVSHHHADSPLVIRLSSATIRLQEVVVWTEDPEELVRIAMRKIPDNYARLPELYRCFYRETAMKHQHFIYVAEGVTDMFKGPYSRGITRDRVAIRKGRRLLSPKKGDTLSVKVMGGPVQSLQLDLVKNRDFLLNEEELSHYSFLMEPPAVIDNRVQYVISIAPKATLPYALYYGRFYIDHETLAFTRVELSLDMSDRDKATSVMLIRKPMGVRFRPKELSCLIDYHYDGEVTRISYLRSTFRFNCDWKRRLFATSFTACCEMVVTDNSGEDVHPISGNSSFDARDSFYDKVDYFLDPNFWEDYNIIEPTETLDRAIGKLIRQIPKSK